jgi:hypothetical protein
VVSLTLTEPEPNLLTTQVHFVRPREAIKGHVFKILIHLDVMEDLMFYHYLREEPLADGKVPLREFPWQYGQPDGNDLSDYLHPLLDFAPHLRRAGGVVVMMMKEIDHSRCKTR